MFKSKVFYLINIIYATTILCSRDVEVKTEEDLGVKYANRCEVCRVLATELQSRLEETGKVREVLEIGYSLDDVQPKKKKKYEKSELRLIESLDGVCEKILEYNIHKERQDSTRFAKGMSQTFKTLHGLVDKGVKVDLGIPYELWDKPSAEITHMKTQCESLLEDNEDAIEYWYWNLQGTKDLKMHLCTDHALRNTDNSCLYDNLNQKGEQGSKSNEKLLPKDELAQTNGKKMNVNLDPETDLDDLLITPDKNLNVENIAKKEELSEKTMNKQRGDQGDETWNDPSQYAQEQFNEKETLEVINKSKLNQPDVKDDEVTEKIKSEREDL